MIDRFNPTPAAVQQHTNAFTLAAATTAQQSSKSSISGSSSDSSFFSTVLDVITFIPRKIWGLIQMLLCCDTSPVNPPELSLVERVESDPEAAAQHSFDQLKEITEQKEVTSKWAKIYAPIKEKDPKWKQANIDHLSTYLEKLVNLINKSQHQQLQIVAICIPLALAKLNKEEEFYAAWASELNLDPKKAALTFFGELIDTQSKNFEEMEKIWDKSSRELPPRVTDHHWKAYKQELHRLCIGHEREVVKEFGNYINVKSV